MKHFDVIVIGVGSMGSAACYYLASQGYSVLGLEQFDIPHDRGSHAGQSRIIRKAYFEHPDYVPLLQRAYENWHTLEAKTGQQIYFPTGLLYAGKPESILIKGVLESAAKYHLPVEKLSPQDCHKRFPAFQIPDDYMALYEPDAGFLTPERAILLFTEQAIRYGATIHTKENVIQWHREGDSIQVHTNKGTYHAKKLIITAGPWAGQLIPELAAHLTVTRQAIAWMIPQDWHAFMPSDFPCWLFHDHTQPGMFYGFPVLKVGMFGAPIGLKVAHHYPGKMTDADRVDRSVHPEDELILVDTIKKFFPLGYSSTHTVKTCLYTNTPDENFVIDFLPGHDKHVVMAAGFSGHGFKFASVVGEILADLAMEGHTKMPIDFLGVKRMPRTLR